MSLSTVKTTATAFTKQPTKAPPEQPLVTEVTVKPVEASSMVEHSSQRSEEVSDGDNLVEYSTEQSSEKWNECGSNESYTTSEEASAEGTTTQHLLTKLDESEPESTVNPVAMAAQDSSDTNTSLESTTPKEEEEDSETSADESNSTEELFKTTGGLSTWFMDPVTQKTQAASEVKQTLTSSGDDVQPETTLATGSMLDEEEQPIPTTTSVEIDSSTVLQDSTGYSDEQQQFDEMSLTTLNLYSEESTTQTDAEQTVLPQDTSTIPSDAQHAIHKIIESLQSINDNSASDESDEADSQESMYPGDVPGMSYDTDAQSSINAIIQSLGQGALGGAGGDSSIFSITTESITTPEEELATVTQPVVKSNPSTVQPVLKTSKPTVAPEEPQSTSIFNYNTNIMETIEKFLSSFGSLPKESTYSANLTKLNILSDYPAEINMTDYVDRTATVASVLKFPQSASREEVADVTDEVESFEDTTTESELTLADQPILSDPMASFMKLGEMLTMGTKISSTERPAPVQQLEVKTAIDEEETELLRFLQICSNLGTTVYDYLTDASHGTRSLLGGRSLVYSPFATITTLSMLFLGTRGTTAESINGVIGLDEMTSFNPHLFFKSIAADLTPKYRRTFAREGNGSGADSTFSRTLLSDESRGGLQRFFKARIQEIYSTVAETVDFRQKDMLLRHMNGDFPREYVDTLKQLRSPLVSISRNRYRHDCNGAATSFGTLQFKQRNSASPPSIVPSVSFRSGFSTGYSKVLDATILALPGSTSNVSVYFIKPSTAASDVSELEAHLRNQSISNVLKLFPDETVRTAYAEVQLPYFTQTTIYNMTESIRQLGLQNLFEPSVANFNGLQDSATANLHLSEFIQTDSFALCGAAAGESVARTIPLRSFSTNLVKHTVEPAGDRLMRRNGRKLALRNRSAFETVPNLQDSSSSSSSSSKLVFDTPFFYLVRHNPTGMVLYMGRFVGNA
uniref:Serpin domain-containing protein n=1 Tax=Anopheles stephensi TaxID=30069 RepID=A0A182YJ23_ANOST